MIKKLAASLACNMSESAYGQVCACSIVGGVYVRSVKLPEYKWRELGSAGPQHCTKLPSTLQAEG